MVGWLDYLYDTTVSGISSSFKYIGINDDSYTYTIGKAIVNSQFDIQAKTNPQVKISTNLSDKIMGYDDDNKKHKPKIDITAELSKKTGESLGQKVVQKLLVYDPFSADLSDTIENLKQKNYGTLLHGVTNYLPSVYTPYALEDTITTAAAKSLLLPTLASIAPTALVGVMPVGVIASAAYLVVGKTIIDTVKRSVFGGTLTEYYNAAFNPFGIKGITRKELEAYPNICGKVLSNHSNMMDNSEKLYKLYQEVNIVVFKLKNIDLNSKEKYESLNKEYNKYVEEYKIVLNNYQVNIENILEGYKSFAKMQEAGFASKTIESLKEVTIEKKQELKSLKNNLKAFDKGLKDSIEIQKTNHDEKKTEENMAYFYRDLNKKGYVIPRSINKQKKNNPNSKKEKDILFSGEKNKKVNKDLVSKKRERNKSKDVKLNKDKRFDR